MITSLSLATLSIREKHSSISYRWWCILKVVDNRLCRQRCQGLSNRYIESVRQHILNVVQIIYWLLATNLVTAFYNVVLMCADIPDIIIFERSTFIVITDRLRVNCVFFFQKLYLYSYLKHYLMLSSTWWLISKVCHSKTTKPKDGFSTPS